MSSNPKIWVLGEINTKAEKNIGWLDPWPNFADPDVLIINLDSLSTKTLASIDVNKYKEASDTILDKFLHGGIIIIITCPAFYARPKIGLPQSNYELSPISLKTKNVTQGTEILYDELHPFLGYLRHVKNFKFYLEDFRYSRIQSPAVTALRIQEVAAMFNRRITDKAGHILGQTFTRGGNVGELVFLPPVTNISVKEGINKIIDSLRKSEPQVEESTPTWVSNITVVGVSEKYSSLQNLESQKLELGEKIKSLNKDIQKLQNYRRLLYSNGPFLEESVYDAFKLLGFKEIKQIREKDKEDGVIEFQKRTDFKYGVIEIEGSDKRTSIEKLDQCHRWVNDHFLLGNEVKGVFISNQFRSNEYPQSKAERIHYEHNQLKYADTRKLCIIPSCVLFEAVNKTFEGKGKSRSEIEKLIAETNGILEEL